MINERQSFPSLSLSTQTEAKLNTCHKVHRYAWCGEIESRVKELWGNGNDKMSIKVDTKNKEKKNWSRQINNASLLMCRKFHSHYNLPSLPPCPLHRRFFLSFFLSRNGNAMTNQIVSTSKVSYCIALALLLFLPKSLLVFISDSSFYLLLFDL